MFNLTTDDQLAARGGPPPLRERASRKSPSRTLQGKVWLHYLLSKTGLSPKRFSSQFMQEDADDPASLIYTWLNTETTPTLKMVVRVSEDVPGALALYKLPLWGLLENALIKKKELDTLIVPYWNPRGCPILDFWDLPVFDELRARRLPSCIMGKYNSEALMQRGDIYALIAILGGIREAELIRDGWQHCKQCMDLYRILPAILKLEWFEKNEELLIKCIDAVRNRVFGSDIAFRVNWDVINRQALDPGFETLRDLRPRDPVTKRFVALEDPIILRF